MWLRVNYPTPADIASETWVDFSAKLQASFKPKDHSRRARDVLAACTQTGSVMGYAAAFQRALLGCTDVDKPEALDKFIRGLRKDIRTEVIFREPASLDDAVVLAERA